MRRARPPSHSLHLPSLLLALVAIWTGRDATGRLWDMPAALSALILWEAVACRVFEWRFDRWASARAKWDSPSLHSYDDSVTEEPPERWLTSRRLAAMNRHGWLPLVYFPLALGLFVYTLIW